jgi:hypothetical protein
MIGSSRSRSSVVAVAVAVPTAAAVMAVIRSFSSAPGFEWGAIGVIAAILAVAQASPEPTSQTSALAWQVAGAAMGASRLPKRISVCLLGWGAVLTGAATGALLGLLLVTGRPDWRDAGIFVGGGLVVVPVVALSVRPQSNAAPRRSRARVFWRRFLVVGRIPIGIAAVVLAVVVAGQVQTDFDAFIAIPVCVLLTAMAVMLAMQPLRATISHIVGRAGRWRALLALADRHPIRFMVRVVIVIALIVAATGVVLGQSVATRSQRIQNAIADLRRVPAVPPNVMVLTLGTAASSRFSSAAVAAVTKRFPTSEVIPVESASSVIITVRGLPLVLDNPQLQAVYGPLASSTESALAPDLTPAFIGQLGANSISGSLFTRPMQSTEMAPLSSHVVRALLQGHGLPAVSWQGVNFVSVSRAASGIGTATPIEAIMVTQPRPYTAGDRHLLEALGNSPMVVQSGHIGALTADQRTNVEAGDLAGPVPWAPTAPATQWLITLLAASLAVLLVVSAGAVDALDRRHDNRFLERLGATPGQVRGGNALNSGLELGIAALLACGSVAVLVAWGIRQYSFHSSGMPLVFVLPVAQIALLGLGVPIVGAAIAAALARPSYPIPNQQVASVAGASS